MNFKSYKQYTLANDAFLFQLFTELPANAFINKGKCGNGGTTLEILNGTRSSIIIVPNRTIVKGKRNNHLFMQDVIAEVSVRQIEIFLMKDDYSKKIITTPEGMTKIIKAATNIGLIDVLYNDWFLLLDECHSMATEIFRDGILRPMEYFWQFQSKTMISATPYFFTDPRMKLLDYYHIKIQGSLGKINLVDAFNVKATLQMLIDQSLKTGERLFIFFNSIYDFKALVKKCGLTHQNCSIYCANDREGKNIQKLGEYKCMLRAEPDNNAFTLVNFFTTANFEGWDLNTDERCKMVVATDVNLRHSTVGMNKCFQAFGRWRLTDSNKYLTPELYHITNHRKTFNHKSIEEITVDYTDQALKIIQHYKEEIKMYGHQLEDPRIAKFCSGLDQSVELDHYKLDRFINEAFNIEVYNHLSYIQNYWREYNYEIITTRSIEKWTSNRDLVRMSAADILKRDYEALVEFIKDENIFKIERDLVAHMESTNPLAVKALVIPKSTMEALKYNPKKVKEAIVLQDETTVKLKMLQLVSEEFKRGNRYTLDHIKSSLQSIYNTLNLTDKYGKRRIASATHINKFFEVKECKIAVKDGSIKNGYELLRATLSMTITADQ